MRALQKLQNSIQTQPLVGHNHTVSQSSHAFAMGYVDDKHLEQITMA